MLCIHLESFYGPTVVFFFPLAFDCLPCSKGAVPLQLNGGQSAPHPGRLKDKLLPNKLCGCCSFLSALPSLPFPRSLEDALVSDVQLGALEPWLCCSDLPELDFSEVEKNQLQSHQVCCLS